MRAYQHLAAVPLLVAEAMQGFPTFSYVRQCQSRSQTVIQRYLRIWQQSIDTSSVGPGGNPLIRRKLSHNLPTDAISRSVKNADMITRGALSSGSHVK